MNIKKVEKANKKINQLLENIKEENSVSAIERDLLLSYIRDLYEKVLNTEDLTSKPVESSAPRHEKTISYSAPEPKIEIPTPPPAVKIADVVRQEIRETTQVSEPEPALQMVETPSYSYETTTNSAPVEQVIETIQVEAVPQAPQELLDLFAEVSVNELSDKLSRSPIADLTKSMGINERIFTVNELFDGDSELFNTTMQSLDKLTSLEQARDYLVTHVAVDQEWTNGSKIKKAANFVKLISRRY